MAGYVTNIEQATLENEDYRRVLFTGPNMQLVLMTLRPGEEIGLETHEEHDQFIRPFAVVASCKGGGIAGVAKIHEIDAFDDALAVCVEARDDTPRQGHERDPCEADATKFASTRAPVAPDFSGWNCTAQTLVRSTTATNGRP